MDLLIRFWDKNSNKVQVQYWGSLLLGYTKYIDLLKRISDGLTGFRFIKTSSFAYGSAQRKLVNFKRGQKGKRENWLGQFDQYWKL